MAVTILERPEGHILGTCVEDAAIDDNGGGGEFRVAVVSHGFTTGDYIYIYSDVYNYNGFWYVDVQGVNTFLIRPYAGGDYVQYISGSLVNYCPATLTHGWSCVHLPITYRLSTDLYPTNSVDTTRNINSVQEANGYTVLQLSGDLGSGVNTYDFVKITVPADTDLSGVYQILEFISPTVMIINLAYDSGNNFTSATALKHYNNYNILVRVYSGINTTHEWTAQKPYELAATLQFIPDEDNQVFFSINEILKSYIETRNNLVLGTLPNNIDFWTNFYIEVSESYDDSDGYSPGTTTGNYTSDQSNFEGTAVNAQLEFKNLQSGYLSDYLMTNNTAKFLTLFTIPVLFQCGDDTPNCYSDISFLLPETNAVTIQKDFYTNGVLQSSTSEDLGEMSYGVNRTPLEADCDYDRVDISLEYTERHLLYDPELDILAQAFASRSGLGNYWGIGPNALGWTQTTNLSYGGFTLPNGCWRYDGAELSFGLLGPASGDNSELLFTNLLEPASGHLYLDVVSTNFSVSQCDIEITFQLTSNGTPVSTQTITKTPTGLTNLTGTIDFGEVVNADRLLIYINKTVEHNPVWSAGSGLEFDTLDLYGTDIKISETKQFKIVCGCVNQEIRLTWLNNLGGFDYWTFTAEKDHIREIQEVMTTKKNILPTWPKSYGADADTIRKQTNRVSNKAYTVRSQFLTSDEADALSYIKSSILVQIINSQTDRRTVIVDSDSFIVRKDGDDTFEVAFNISFTDDIPVQTA